MSNIYTKKGDQGQTSLLSGERVGKTDPRVEAYGVYDEMGASLGLARIYAVCSRDLILWLQQRNFALCAELAGGDIQRLTAPISDDDLRVMESAIDRIDNLISRRPGFTIPANNAASGFLHQARTIARRGERRVLALRERMAFRPQLLRYINRLSDLLYMLAREEEFIETLSQKIQVKLAQYKGGGNMSDNESKLYELADQLLTAGISKAREIGVPMVLAVVDSGGNLVAFRRMPDSLLASVDIAQGKAFSAMSLRMSTDQLAQAVQPGNALYGLEASNLGRIVPFGGGYPLYIGGELVGGFGMSGGTVEEDMLCASYALDAVKLK